MTLLEFGGPVCQNVNTTKVSSGLPGRNALNRTEVNPAAKCRRTPDPTPRTGRESQQLCSKATQPSHEFLGSGFELYIYRHVDRAYRA